MDGELGEAPAVSADELGRFDRIPGDETALPGGGAHVEEWSASSAHWVLILALIFGAWWLRSRGGGGSASAQSAPAHVDHEDLRRKRLEALERAASSAAKVPEEAAAAEASEVAGEVPQLAAKADEKTSEQEQNLTKKNTTDQSEEAASATAAVPCSASFVVTARGILRGVTTVRTIDGLSAASTLSELYSSAHSAFELAGDARLRLFFKDKELKSSSGILQSAGITSGATVQVMFVLPTAAATSSYKASSVSAVPATASTATTAAPTVAPPRAASTAVASAAPAPVRTATPSATSGSASASADSAGASAMAPARAVASNGASFSLRAQATIDGATVVHPLEVCGATTVTELEGLVLQAFVPGDDVRPRLFYMGRELKDGDACLELAGVKPSSTIQVMFAAGKPRAAPAAQAFTSNADQAVPSPAQVASAAAAATSPAEAWKAMAALQEHLAAALNPREDATVRNAAMVLRQMLQTATHDQNPALLNMAQVMVPDFSKIWGFEPTRDHLVGLLKADASLAAGVAQDSSATGAASSSSG